ncbi:THUMP domain-containing protein 3 [Modicella reniformis]|uniref:THUMP domain-containing protein 3 n=1 Tax=Modicella reniformis TaxID=1440133 RepID=A0A9P6LX84_9FUNG|nr:THUMP domain-containing protein 3 [Modicella reniformis]
MAISSLVLRPPLCVFAAYITIGEVEVPRDIFEAPKDLLDYINGGFQQQIPRQDNGRDLQEKSAADLGWKWQDALSILRRTSPSLAERHHDHGQCDTAGEPIRFRASFDRGNVQHNGVRSQDIAAGLGGLTGKLFPSWKVDLKDFDIEIMGRWIHEDLEEITAVENITQGIGRHDDQVGYSHHPTLVENRISLEDERQRTSQKVMRIQVGMALPLALSSCPYRFRPMDGRTSLKIEIGYTLLALAGPQPGDVVIDLCSGVGTIPIVGAVHYPGSMFAGFEILPHNVDKAAENARGMLNKVQQERASISGALASTVHGAGAQPSLLLGDARAVCWRSGTVDVIVSDLPWGQRESSHHYNCKLYPRLTREVLRLLRVGGRAVLVTGERKLLQRQLDAPFSKPYLRVLKRREITIGFKVMVFEVIRI